MSKEHRILIDYTNHASVRQVREIEPVEPGALVFNSSEWHPEPQWLLNAYDHGKDDMRTFAVAGIRRWGVEPGRQMDIDLSIAAQLQRSMELNARMKERLRKFVAEYVPDDPLDNTCEQIQAVLRDEDPT